MIALFVTCLVMNVLDAVGTWYTVGVAKIAFEANPVVAGMIATVGWPIAMFVKVIVVSWALYMIYRARIYFPRAVKWIFIGATIVYGLMLGAQVLAIILALTI